MKSDKEMKKEFKVIAQKDYSKYYPVKTLKELGFKNNEFFGSTVYSSAHDISMQLISKGVIDGACVDGLIYEYMAEHHSESVKQINIIKIPVYIACIAI